MVDQADAGRASGQPQLAGRRDGTAGPPAVTPGTTGARPGQERHHGCRPWLALGRARPRCSPLSTQRRAPSSYPPPATVRHRIARMPVPPRPREGPNQHDRDTIRRGCDTRRQTFSCTGTPVSLEPGGRRAWPAAPVR
jgi:hypothetical protein